MLIKDAVSWKRTDLSMEQASRGTGLRIENPLSQRGQNKQEA